MPQRHTLIYIHGFSSSPASWKARLLSREINKRSSAQIEIPQLPFSPEAAIHKLENLIHHYLQSCTTEQLTLIGSSLGGYYAIYLAHQYDLKAILINPAVKPYQTLKDYLGENRNYHSGEVFTFYPHHVDELQRYDISQIRKPERFLLMVQTADEVLDYRQAMEKLPESSLILQEGGNHSFDDFDNMIPEVLKFAGIE